jgi:hypothetical protein
MANKYTFNTENWSGESATIEVEDNSFEFLGYVFTLVARPYECDGKTMTDYVVHADGWSEPLYTIRHMPADTLTSRDFYWCCKYDIERNAANPFVVAAQMAAMTI